MDNKSLELLQKLKDKNIMVSNKHTPYINRLKGNGYIFHDNGEWVVTAEGEKYLNDKQDYFKDTTE